MQQGMPTEEKRQRREASIVRRAEVIDWIWRSDCSKECRQRRRGRDGRPVLYGEPRSLTGSGGQIAARNADRGEEAEIGGQYCTVKDWIGGPE